MNLDLENLFIWLLAAMLILIALALGGCLPSPGGGQSSGAAGGFGTGDVYWLRIGDAGECYHLRAADVDLKAEDGKAEFRINDGGYGGERFVLVTDRELELRRQMERPPGCSPGKVEVFESE